MTASAAITSPANPAVKRLVKIRSSRRHRDREGAFIIEGFRELTKAVGAGIAIDELYVCEDLFLGTNEPALVERIEASGARLRRLAPGPFRKAAYRDRPEGLLAVAPHFDTGLSRLDPPQDPLLLVAEAIEKPGNLGAMLRTADSAGAAAVVAADPGADLFNPNAVRASLGSLFTVPLAAAPADEVMEWLDSRGIVPVVTSPAASSPHWEIDYTGPTAVVVGSEQYGLSRPWLDGRYPAARIPMAGAADSLNTAAAAAVVLFEAVRQRRAAKSDAAARTQPPGRKPPDAQEPGHKSPGGLGSDP